LWLFQVKAKAKARMFFFSLKSENCSVDHDRGHLKPENYY